MNKFFLDNYTLPTQLNKQEMYELLIRTKQGDEVAKRKLVEHNIRLVIYEVKTNFNTVEYDKNDLVGTGLIGLIKAIYSFDMSKNIEFSTYASVCINNEICMLLRKSKKDKNVDSLERSFCIDNDGTELKLEDVIGCDNDPLENYITEETYLHLRCLIDSLPYREKEIIMMQFGFYEDKLFTQKEISQKFNLSQSYISRITRRIINFFKIELESNKSLKKAEKQLQKIKK